MSSGARLGFLAAAIAVLVIAFIVLRPSSEDTELTADPPTPTPTASASATGTAEPTETPTPKPTVDPSEQGRTAMQQPQRAQPPPGGKLGDALRNLQRYVDQESFDNQRGGTQDRGAGRFPS